MCARRSAPGTVVPTTTKEDITYPTHLPRITEANQVKPGDTVLYHVRGSSNHSMDWSFVPGVVQPPDSLANLGDGLIVINDGSPGLDTLEPASDEVYLFRTKNAL